jgi:PAS domain S-box-containing protein/diguanylate cyclase (GGDEF)-like protein
MIDIKYKELLENISDWIWAVDENGVYTYCSKNVFDFLGYNAEEVVGKTPFDFMSQEEQQRIGSIFLDHVQNKKSIVKLVNTHIHKNGYEVVVETSGIPILDVNGELIGYQGLDKDISKHKETEYELDKTVSFLKSHQLALDESSIVTKSDLKGNITYVNDAFCKVTGYTKEEIIGKPHNIIRHPDNPKSLYEAMWNTLRAKKTWKGILKNKGKLQDYWVDLIILPIVDDKNEIVEYIGVRHDVTKVIQQQDKLDNIANTDFLTALGSRYKLINDISLSNSCALAIINIDSFSQINDLFGHKIGDDIIIQYANRLNELKYDERCHMYHLQGDEYVVLDTNINRDEFLEKIMDIAKKLDTIKVIVNNEELSLSFTTAISFESKDSILQTADMALKIAKKENKSLIIYRDEISLNNEYENNLTWTKKIKEAIESNNIVPVFQPIVNNHNGNWQKYEALVRIKDGDKLISPYFFLDISKKTKQYLSITKIMIEKTFETFKDNDKTFSINITIEDILNDEIKAFIYSMLENYKIGSRVVFEIVESESIEEYEIVHNFIEKVKSYGSKIAIDDFGTGYSNFEYLLKLKVDFIKIDGSMIKNIDKSTDAQVVVSVIVDFAKKMGIETIAEFVENEAIFNKVKELGIDYSQGYYFAKPELEI